MAIDRQHGRISVSRHLGMVLVMWVLGAHAIGCAPTAVYQPDTTAVEIVGPQAAAIELEDVLNRIIYPRMFDVDVTPEYFKYDLLGTKLGPLGEPVGTRDSKKIWFHQLRRIDYNPADDSVYLEVKLNVYQLHFRDAQDAQRFVDLVMSFHEYAIEGGVAGELADES